MVDFLPANHDFRGFAGFQHFDISNGKLLLGLLLPNSAYKRCHLQKERENRCEFSPKP